MESQVKTKVPFLDITFFPPGHSAHNTCGLTQGSGRPMEQQL